MQKDLEHISGMDEFLAGKCTPLLKTLMHCCVLVVGMLSKSRGYVLRVSAVIHMLRSFDSTDLAVSEG